MKVAICGHHAFGKVYLDGQTIKTQIISNAIENKLGSDNVLYIDTCGTSNIIKMFFKLLYALYRCENIIILPAHNGLKYISVWLHIWNHIFKRRIHYIVIGGWLNQFLDNHKIVSRSLRKFHKIYVETETMKNALLEKNFVNTTILPNCKNLHIISEDSLQFDSEKPFRLVTFSRVMEQKGIGEAIEIVTQVNQTIGSTALLLDIYGPIDPNEIDWFDKIIKQSNRDYIRYRGCIASNEATAVLKDYFALLFPTKFFTEGIPGTILDAYGAGIPVIASKWESFSDLIEENVTGIGFEFNNWEQLYQILINIVNNPLIINNMRKSCLNKSRSYLPYNIISIILEEL